MATAGWGDIFPGSPDEWSLIAVGEGFSSTAQYTVPLTPLGNPVKRGLKAAWLQPDAKKKKKKLLLDSFTVLECVYEQPSPFPMKKAEDV